MSAMRDVVSNHGQKMYDELKEMSRAGFRARLLICRSGPYLLWKRATERNFTALPVNRLASAIWLSAWKPAV